MAQILVLEFSGTPSVVRDGAQFFGPTPSPICHPRRKWPGSFSPPRELGRELLSAVTGVLLRGNAGTHGRVIDGMMDEKIVWIRQPDRNDDATRRVGR
jgi:hypothetical protein